ncbi:DNA repair protein rad14 [Cryomyces antarcticus]|uniref:DNA repair protein rad14 n=1 Tax=Cryomyces antarcticus TaxID=329879 RepID=A0ABR0LW53_9PEZI|nr:DNA repair protein rad14 [Cryomyces antarcticus]KAK5012458.1 DNA repair protein rad14 [Cryomyces antarcticus]KAK5250529.1 DNA repair protein rad14 [Cryomyces antarcticus]
MAERPSTPPRASHPGTLPRAPLTPEQVRRTSLYQYSHPNPQEESRLKAKALRDQRVAAERKAGTAPVVNRTPSGFIAGEKRPISAISTSNVPHTQRDARNSNRPDGDGGFTKPPDNGIQAAKKFTKYIDYDFSKMTDTKGGFLTAEDDPHNRALHTPNQEEKPAHMTLREWERHQLLKRLREQKAGPFEPGLSVLKGQAAKKCRECGSLEIDWKWDEVFGCQVCNACKEKVPDKYTLLTKTEAREDYLLTEPELKDESLLPHLERPNPHKATWNNMMLYLRYQVEDYAFSEKKWGSPEALDDEFTKRQAETKRRKEAKFKSKLNELKKRTRVDAYKRSRQAGGGGGQFGDIIGTGKHEHEWGRSVENPETGVSVKSCVECGMEVEELEF